MPLQAPNLDDRRFDSLVREARALIPRYLPEWTDWNQSDPGITLIQLFAWMSEQLLYRMNKLPEQHLIEFLRLLGVERKPAQPARAELTFTLTASELVSVAIPGRARAAATPDEGDPVVFETDEALIAIGAQLQAVQTFDGAAFADWSEANASEGRQFPAFGANASEQSALYLGFASPRAFPTDEINLTVHLAAATPEPQSAEEQPLAAAAQVRWEHWDGNQWAALELFRDETRAFTRSGHVYVRGPRSFPPRQLGLVNDELYWLRARLVRAGYQAPPLLEEILTNTVWATAVATVQDEVLGSSNGRPDQSFTLRSRPVLAEPARMDQIRERRRRAGRATAGAGQQATIRAQERRKGFLLEVDEATEAGFEPWEEVDDFYESRPDDRHYTLNRATGELRFGDGRQGKIPLAGRENIVARLYRYGGGAAGNVAAGKISALQTSIAYVEGVTNRRAAEGGTDEEPIDDAKLRGSRTIKARDRAVTPDDFAQLALETPGARIRRARAYPLRHPQFPGVAVPGAITVVVVPDSKEPRPMPTDSTLQLVCAHLNQHRLLTSELFVAPPQYSAISIAARVIVRADADLAEVRQRLNDRLNQYFHPLTGGPDQQGWEPGADVYYSEVIHIVLEVAGVQRIEDLRILVDGQRLGAAESASIADGFLVFSENHSIEARYERGI